MTWKSWVEWAVAGKLLAETIQFGEENPQLLFEPKPDDQRPWCTPRSLHQIDIHLQSLMRSFDLDKIPTDPLTQEEVKGGIGAPACAQLMKTIRLGQELSSFEEVVANPMKVTLPGKPDAQRLMAYKIASRVAVENANLRYRSWLVCRLSIKRSSFGWRFNAATSLHSSRTSRHGAAGIPR